MSSTVKKFDIHTLNKELRGRGMKLPVTAFYTCNFIKLVVTGDGISYKIDQLGDTQNPNLTCYRGSYYRFFHNQSEYPFALRMSLDDNSTPVPGAVDNNTNLGIIKDIIYFSPNDNTPNTIYYQCPTNPSMYGTITILNYD